MVTNSPFLSGLHNHRTVILLDPDGLKVDGIAYTREQVRDEGRTLVF